MTKLLDWLVKKPETASTQELELQVEHAREALETAREHAAEAEEAFDLDPAKETAALKAHEAVSRALLHLRRAERLLQTRRDEEAQQAHEAKRQELAELNTRYADLHAAIREDESSDVVSSLLAAAKAQAGRHAQIEDLRVCGRQLARMQSEIDGIPYDEGLAALRSNEPIGSLDTALLLFRDELEKARPDDMGLYESGHELFSRLTHGRTN